MKALRALRTLASTTTAQPFNPQKLLTNSAISHRLYSAESEHDDSLPPTPEEYNSPQDDVFDSSHFDDLNLNSSGGSNIDTSYEKGTWNEKYRDRVKSQVFGEDISYSKILKREEEKKKKAAFLAKALLKSALDEAESDNDVDERELKEEDQKSVSVGIIGAPNAGKSALTNCLVGTKVSAVSRKINTTTHEVLGVLTKGVTQMCFFDTPGLMLKKNGFPYNDIKVRVESAWSSINLYDVLIVIFDVHRHITRPDSRVVRLIERMGSVSSENQKRVLCLNKVDLVPKKSDLYKVVDEFKDLPGYEKHFMISGLKGAGVKDLTKYLMEQAVKRPWDEDPFAMSEEVMKNISLEIVREKLLDYVHQEIPYVVEHRLMGWKELRDDSLRIEQNFITDKISQRKILLGKKGTRIKRIEDEAIADLQAIFKKKVHLFVSVK